MKRSFIARASALALVAASVMVVGSRVVQGEPDQLPGVGGIHWARDHQPQDGRAHRNRQHHPGPRAMASLPLQLRLEEGPQLFAFARLRDGNHRCRFRSYAARSRSSFRLLPASA